METPEFIRFFEYVERTSRVDARPKRMALFALLSGRTFVSVTALVQAVAGNTKDRMWVAQAQKDGEVIRLGGNGALTVPSARGEAEAVSTQEPEAMYALARAALLALEAMPEWTNSRLDVTRQAVFQALAAISVRMEEIRQAHQDETQSVDPQLNIKRSWRWHLRHTDHAACVEGGGHCGADDCPGRQH
jgi:hypothetical protein